MTGWNVLRGPIRPRSHASQLSGESICLERVGTAYTAEGLQRITREVGKSIEWLLTGEDQESTREER
jgi:hypothetical protein